MARTLLLLVIMAGLATPALAGTVSDQDFKATTTQNLINLCAASKDDPLYREAHNFCQGYLVGAYHYHMAANEGPEGKQIVCFPDPPPSRVHTISMFIEWVKAHPEHLGERPVETQFRFLVNQWPCKR